MSVAGLPTGLVQLADMLGVAPQRLFDVVTHANNRYVDIHIPKAKGGLRNISIPSRELKGLQRLIYWNIFKQFPVHEIAAAYKPGSSIVHTARQHSSETTSLQKFDLKDFFPSITSPRVFGYLRHRGFDSGTAYILTKLVIHNGSLPQGAPTSPVLSNAICYSMDRAVSDFASSWDLTVTRYSDDFIFSGRNFDHSALASRISQIVRNHGFSLNTTKTRYMRRGSPQKALGLLVDKNRPRMTRTMLRRIRAAFHNAAAKPQRGIEQLGRLHGYAGFYKQVYGSDERYLSFVEILKHIQLIRNHEIFQMPGR